MASSRVVCYGTEPAMNDKPLSRPEAGYALLAAVASIAVGALIAVTIIGRASAGIESVGAEIGHAQATAAAEAGVAIAISDVLGAGAVGSAPIDGRVRRSRFGNADLTVIIEDEKGKVPINNMEDRDIRTLMQEVGLTGARLAVATDSLLDWMDDDEDPRPNGAESSFYAARGLYARNGDLRSIAEVALVRGVDGDIAERLARIATVHFGNGPFTPAHASPAALRVMLGDIKGAVDIIERQREQAGQRTAIALGTNSALANRTLTISVEARLDNGASTRLRELVTITGRAAQPYYVRERL